ncbi:MAG: DUF2147 domain-containing protein [Betaproteobacteria bacterium]
MIRFACMFPSFLSLLVTVTVGHAGQPQESKSWPAEQLTGLWQQYDDDTKLLSSLVRIVHTADDQYEGFVEKVIPGPGEDPNPRCRKCEGELKDKPVLGIRVLWSLRRVDETHFEHGEIIDPDDGTVYRLKIAVVDKGRKIEVRGYKGISLFGRTQVWLRAPATTLPAESTSTH